MAPVANSDGSITVSGITKMPTAFMLVLGVDSAFESSNNGDGSGGIPDKTMIFLYSNGTMLCRQFGQSGGELTQYDIQYDFDVTVSSNTLTCTPSSENTAHRHITKFAKVLSTWGLVI